MKLRIDGKKNVNKNDKGSFYVEEESLDDESIRARLDVIASVLEAKRAEDDKEHEKKIKECRATSVMTKYQMIFTKIEVYMADLVRFFCAKERNMKLIVFLRMKHASKLKPRVIDCFAKTTLYRLVNGLSALAAAEKKLKIKMMIRGLVFLKFSNPHVTKDKALLANTATAKVNILRMFNKSGSKKCVLERPENKLTESGADGVIVDKAQSQARAVTVS